jgi:hypothetical protein
MKHKSLMQILNTHTAATNEGHNERKLHNQERNIQQVE